MKRRVLLVDNDPDFAETWAEILERAGYETIVANSAEQAEAILARVFVHLMMIDVRLRDDTDRKDASGLLLAKKEAYRSIRKIILTRYPHIEQVRSALRAKDGVAPAVDFLDKAEGKKGILRAVAEAFDNHIRVNWELGIESQVSFLHLADMIEPGLDRAFLPERAQELEDLFRRLFPSERQLRIDKALWQSEGRVALRVHAFADSRSESSAMVVCGQSSRIMEDARNSPGFGANTAGLHRTHLQNSVGGVNLAANLYTLVGAELDKVRSLADVYRSGQERQLAKALESLFQETFAPYFKEKYISEDWDSLGALCRARFGLADLIDAPEEFEKRLRFIASQATLFDTKMEFASGSLRFHLGGQSHPYPDPLGVLRRDFDLSALVNAPVVSSGERILVNDSGTWLTDFASAGPMPLFWNFVTIEAMIRFDWVEAAKPQSLHKMERCLTDNFTLLNIGDLDLSLRIAARAVQAVRKLVFNVLGDDQAPYQWGLLFEAMRRIAGFDPESQLTRNERARLLHAAIAAAVISGKLAKAPPRSMSPASRISIDKVNRSVSVREQRLQMKPGKVYDLLCFFYDRPNQLCTPREILEKALNTIYYEGSDSRLITAQNNHVYVNIRRLRETIEIDPDNPRHLLNEPGGGYKLVINLE